MTLVIETQPLPLIMDFDGVVRISETRVTLDTIIYAFRDGATAEEIVQQYPALSLSDTYSVIGYYLQQSNKVNAYLHRREASAIEIKEENEARFSPDGVRERLLARHG